MHTEDGQKLNAVMAYRHFNLLHLFNPPSAIIEREIADTLKVDRVVYTRDFGRPKREIHPESCYHLEQTKLPNGNLSKQFTMGFGFVDHVREIMRRHRIHLIIEDNNPADVDTLARLIPDMDYARKVAWRENQAKIIEDITSHSHGQYVAATGAGKSFTLRHLCKVFPRARILVTTYSAGLLHDLHAEVTANGDVDAGIYSSKCKNPLGRVLFCSLGCLNHFSNRVWDILIVDEKHECATLNKVESLLAIRCRKAYALSANHEDRADAADMWLVALFGKNRVNVSHQDVVADMDVVPVEIKWERLLFNGLQHIDAMSPTAERQLIWQNERRNIKLAELATANSEQSLVYVKTVEHAYILRQMLDCPVAHAAQSPERWDQLKQQGLVGAQERNPSHAELELLRKHYAQGKHNLAICNAVWKRGVNFHRLTHLIRGDGSVSTHDGTQITGRVTRTFEGKVKAYVYDIQDAFHDSSLRKSIMRRAIYKKIGYQQTGWK